jgi:hypothetical protein
MVPTGNTKTYGEPAKEPLVEMETLVSRRRKEEQSPSAHMTVMPEGPVLERWRSKEKRTAEVEALNGTVKVKKVLAEESANVDDDSQREAVNARPTLPVTKPPERREEEKPA